MQLSKQDLIQICDKFLQDEIGPQEVEDFAWKIISSDRFEWEDEIVADILFQWDSPEINFPINKANMESWKRQLAAD